MILIPTYTWSLITCFVPLLLVQISKLDTFIIHYLSGIHIGMIVLLCGSDYPLMSEFAVYCHQRLYYHIIFYYIYLIYYLANMLALIPSCVFTEFQKALLFLSVHLMMTIL